MLNLLPNNGTSASPKMIKEPQKIVYASNVLESEMPEGEKGKALLYFTHNHEAFQPVTKEKNGKVSVSHQTENITKFGEKLQAQLMVNGVETEILPVDNMQELNKQGMSFGKSYHSIRPFVEKQVEQTNYDLIIDLHRDSIRRKATAMTHEGEGYAKVAFVIGKEHPNYRENEQMAVQMKAEMESLVPGITRGIIMKGGRGVDGKYNQDIHPSLIVVELGGIENTEDELNRTITVLANAAAAVLANKNDVEN